MSAAGVLALALVLRPYQADAVAEIRMAFTLHRRVLFVLATGAGKTVIFSFITEHAAAKGNRVIVVAHRREIVDQIGIALDAMGVLHGRIQPGFPVTDHTVQIAMTQTLARRLDAVAEPVLLVIDEAHHSVSATYSRITAAWPNARILGVTATPERLDGRGLCDAFDTMVLGPDVAELIEAGYLARFRYFAPAVGIDLSRVRSLGGDYNAGDLERAVDQDKITGDVVKHYLEHLAGRSAIVFCCTIAHAEHVAQRFRDANIPAASIDGTMSSDQRHKLVNRLRTGDLRVLTSCEIISEGFDAPAVGGAILLRPTQSFALFRQQVGRCLRPKSDGSAAIILDHVGNVFRHGLPDAPHTWSLDSTKRTRAERQMATNGTRKCPACDEVFATGVEHATCAMPNDPECLFRPRILDEREGELAEFVPGVDIKDPIIEPPFRLWVRVLAMHGGIHEKPGSPPSFRLRYDTPEGRISDFMTFAHPNPAARGFADRKWQRISTARHAPPPRTAAEALRRFLRGELDQPERILISRDGTWLRVVDAES